jgi:drug/metabolite transporter (DMT)-like permease
LAKNKSNLLNPALVLAIALGAVSAVKYRFCQILTITAAVAAFFFFGKIPTFMQIVGSSIIALGVVIAILARNHSARQRQA